MIQIKKTYKKSLFGDNNFHVWLGAKILKGIVAFYILYIFSIDDYDCSSVFHYFIWLICRKKRTTN